MTMRLLLVLLRWGQKNSTVSLRGELYLPRGLRYIFESVGGAGLGSRLGDSVSGDGRFLALRKFGCPGSTYIACNWCLKGPLWKHCGLRCNISEEGIIAVVIGPK